MLDPGNLPPLQKGVIYILPGGPWEFGMGKRYCLRYVDTKMLVIGPLCIVAGDRYLEEMKRYWHNGRRTGSIGEHRLWFYRTTPGARRRLIDLLHESRGIRYAVVERVKMLQQRKDARRIVEEI